MPQPIIGPLPYTPAWAAIRLFDPERTERPVVFGASEAAAACAQSPYQQPLDLYLRKLGEIPEQDENEAMEFGKLIEPVVLELYTRRTGRKLATGLPMYFHGDPAKSFMAATPDALTIDDEQRREDIIGVDAKSTTDRRYSAGDDADGDSYGEEGSDYVPIDVVMQTQQQMAVLQLERVDVPVLFGRKLRVYSVMRNNELIEAIELAEKELAERIINRDPPLVHWTHTRTKKLLEILSPVNIGEVMQLDEQALDMWLEQSRLGDEIKTLEAERLGLKNRILASMGTAELGRFPLGQKEIRRTVIADSLVTVADVQKAQAMLGQVKRKGHSRLTERKVR